MTTLQTLLAHLVTSALMSDDGDSALWREKAGKAHATLAADPEAARKLKIDGIWTMAMKEAEAPGLRAGEGKVSFSLPALCPFTLDEVLSPGFDLDEAVERIRGSAATG